METASGNMCRCCASEGVFKDLATTYHWMGEEEIYGDMLRECFDIQLSSMENADGGICEVCITQLRNASNFKKQVLLTEEQFKSHLQNVFKPGIVKVEVTRDEGNSTDDNATDDGMSGPEFDDIPIKIEGTTKNEKEDLEIKPKKRSSVKPSTSTAKKSVSSDDEPLKKRKIKKCILHIKKSTETNDELDIKKNIELPEIKDEDSKQRHFKLVKKRKIEKVIITRDKLNKIEDTKKTKTNRPTKVKPIVMHIQSLKDLILSSNATLIRKYGSIGYQCYYCENEYTDPHKLKAHTLTNHNETDKTNIFKKHRGIHTFKVFVDITGLRCELCKSTLETLQQILEHLTKEHNKIFSPDLTKYLIPFKFETKTMSCTICQKEFSNFKILMQHMNEHYRNNICDICAKSFITCNRLRIHMSRHKIGEFACKFCAKVFNTRVKKRDHERLMHVSDKKRNKCGFCGEKFADYTKKNEHAVKMHGVEPIVLKCSGCDRTFDNQRALSAHTKRYHLMETAMPKEKE